MGLFKQAFTLMSSSSLLGCVSSLYLESHGDPILGEGREIDVSTIYMARMSHLILFYIVKRMELSSGVGWSTYDQNKRFILSLPTHAKREQISTSLHTLSCPLYIILSVLVFMYVLLWNADNWVESHAILMMYWVSNGLKFFNFLSILPSEHCNWIFNTLF